MVNRVVAHFLDGRVIKGSVLNIDPARPTFHLRGEDGKASEVPLAQLKAAFFVKDLVGDPQRADGNELVAGDARGRGSVPVEVTFADGERIVGFTVRYPPLRAFFWILPADEASNNERILVNRAAVVKIGQPEA